MLTSAAAPYFYPLYFYFSFPAVVERACDARLYVHFPILTLRQAGLAVRRFLRIFGSERKGRTGGLPFFVLQPGFRGQFPEKQV